MRLVLIIVGITILGSLTSCGVKGDPVADDSVVRIG